MKEILLEIAAFPMFAVGWCAGAVVRILVWARDAVIAGYRDGRGAAT